MNTRAIIICAGDATRWGNHLGVPKHLIEIDGERILDRTVRLLKENGIDDIYIVVKRITEDYLVPGAIQSVAHLNPENVDADKFLSSRFLWNEKGRTIVLYGDVYFSDNAMKTIATSDIKEWTLFARYGESFITGTKWGECFAQSFYPDSISLHEENLYRIADLKKKGYLNRCGGWEHYRAMIGLNNGLLNSHVKGSNFVEIDDWTDDFDYPIDYERFLSRRKKAE